jgi:hypothetical protein
VLLAGRTVKPRKFIGELQGEHLDSVLDSSQRPARKASQSQVVDSPVVEKRKRDSEDASNSEHADASSTAPDVTGTATRSGAAKRAKSANT